MIKLLMKYSDVNAKNYQGKTALDIFEENPCGDEDIARRLRRQRRSTPTFSLSGFLGMELTGLEKYEFFFGFGDETARDIILLVSTLIATATYQAALSPPGGYWQDSSPLPNSSGNSSVATAANPSGADVSEPHRAGDIIMSGASLYFFSIVNSMAFFASIGTIWATAIPLLPRTNMVCVAMFILGIAFSYSLVSQFPRTEEVPGDLLGGFYVALLVFGLVVPWVVWRRHKRIINRIDAPGRRVNTPLGWKGRK